MRRRTSRLAAIALVVCALAIVYAVAWRDASVRARLAGAHAIEILTYVALFVLFASAVVATTRRVCWERPLAVALVAGLWLQTLVFVQPGVLAGVAAVAAIALGLWARPTWLCRAHSSHEITLVR